MQATTIEPTEIVEFDPRARTPTRHQWRYTARPEWSSVGESLWMRLSKFSHCNRMSAAELTRLFARQDTDEALTSVDLRRSAPWDLLAVASTLEISVEDVQASFCCNQGRATRACADLRYCKFCLSAGFHAAWFQWSYIERCPKHGTPLRTGCIQCAAVIPYVLGADLASSPLCCTNCRCHWLPDLARPAGRCAPLPARESALMHRWGDCVRDFVSVADATVRDRKTGRFVGAKPVSPVHTGRPHVLTMFNRLFDDPPPPLRDMTAQAHTEPPLLPTTASAIIGAAEGLIPNYSQDDWPHFGRGFAAHEHLVRAGRSRLFNRPTHELDHERGCRLLAANLVAPATTIDRATAAALGWSVSWLSPCQVLAPQPNFSTPAFGLAAWLADIPPRPSRLAPQDWSRRVTRWLLDDLALSARVWTRMADFMSDRGHYLLYGEAVSPRALARLHEDDDD